MIDDLLRQPPLLHTRKLVAQGRLDDALAVISREIDAFPDWAEPWALMAQVFSRLSRFSEALNSCDQALLRDPWNIGAQELKAALLLQLDYKEAALIAAQRLVSLERSRPESHLFLAFACAFMGMEVEAIEEARACKRLAPRRGMNHQALCVIHLTAKRWALAERHALAAIQIEGPTASLFHDLGLALDRQGRVDSARAAYSMAAQLDARFELSLRRFNRRRILPTVGIPSAIALAAVALLIPMSISSVAFAAMATIGVVVMTIASFRTRSVSARQMSFS